MLLVALFNHVALTPYTHFADNLVALLTHLAHEPAVGNALVADSIGYMMRHLVRHLTAFDLRTFHNRGANYPDALLVDGLLKAFLALIEHDPAVLADAGGNARGPRAARLRRRAVRQAWIVRKECEGLKVPQSPTSPGDVQRVLPSQYARAAEEEVFDPAMRHKTLFAGDPIERRLTPATRSVLQQSWAELDQPLELRELGMAVFLDRPLGIGKQPGEIDRTPLVTYEAFSRSIARQRLAAACRRGLLGESRRAELASTLEALKVQGWADHRGRLPARPGTPCLEDANLAAPDFVFLCTTRGSLDELLRCFDWSELRRALPEEYAWLTQARDVLLIRVAAETPPPGQPLLAAIDSEGRRHWHLCLPSAERTPEYTEEGGLEWLAAGLTLELTAAGPSAPGGKTAMAIPPARGAP
jgi:hypothetical protein